MPSGFAERQEAIFKRVREIQDEMEKEGVMPAQEIVEQDESALYKALAELKSRMNEQERIDFEEVIADLKIKASSLDLLKQHLGL